MNLPRSVNLVLLAVMFGGSALVYENLPDRIPFHFDLSGAPDSWAQKSLTSWFALPGIAVLMTLLMYAMGAILPRYPRFINLPDKHLFLALPEERKSMVVSLMRRFMDWVVVITTVLFMLIQLAVYRASLGINSSLLIVSTVLVGPIVIILAGIFVGRASELYRPASKR